ncbi:MAG: NHL repeat-containing protein [Nitrospinaceae bacterium]
MSEEKDQKEEEESSQDEALEVVDESELDEVDEADEVDEEETAVEEVKPEKGAFMVIGQGDLSGYQSNRGADDPGENTLSEPQFITRFGEMTFISDRGNNRVLIWDTNMEESGESASLVLGQEDFADCLENRGITTTLDEMTSGLGDENLDDFTISMCEDETLSTPAGLAVIDGKLYVSDSGNHRVIRWAGLPTEDGEVPNLVLGQDSLDCNEANRRGLVGSGSLFFPMGIRSGNDRHVFVADKDNHRVLIWNKIPFNNGWNADVCLGQQDMDGREPNRGEFDNVTQDSLSFPTGVFFDPESEKVFVADQGNNRVLIWNKLPSESGTSADVVIGQQDFNSRAPNGNLGSRRASPESLYFPSDVVVGRTGMFISDAGNHRVLYWREIPTENGQPADLVFGQKNFTENKPNRYAEVTNATFNDPCGMFLEEWEDEDAESSENETEGEGEETSGLKFKLYIADRANSRVLVWDELPESPKSEEKLEDEGGEWDMDDPDQLLGEDDEDDYLIEEGEEEQEGELPEETPSA